MNNMKKIIAQSWSHIAPFWPLKNLVATNPLAGFTHLPFEEALHQAASYFQTKVIPPYMLKVNRQTIKWLQIFFDKGEAKISMPFREAGLLPSICKLLTFDKTITIKKEIKNLLLLSKEPEKLIIGALNYLKIDKQDHEQFLTLLLTTLPGWASYAQYKINWGDPAYPNHPHPITDAEYLAFRILITATVWPKAKELLEWHKKEVKKEHEKGHAKKMYEQILDQEAKYKKSINKKFIHQSKKSHQQPDAQLLFCIDVRSEQIRRKIESAGNYETFGIAGFFGLPIIIKNKMSGESYASCPPVIQPQYTIIKTETGWNKKYNIFQNILLMYQSIKYTFATPFALAEIAGPVKGFWLIMRNFFPSMIHRVKHSVFCHKNQYNVAIIPLEKQIEYAQNALKIIGLTNFAPVIVICGHRSSSKNNTYETALDCGACAGRDGLPNAEILVQILNRKEVKTALQIPETTTFFAGQHNTTTDTLMICKENGNEKQIEIINQLKKSLTLDPKKKRRSLDWSQTRPEWGLSQNASLIIGPRWMTKDIDLEGRAFLHSYENEHDTDGSILESIMLGPVIVAHWINSQYLFSTADNVAFGGGSKVTKNIASKVGVMQGNASDLMHGLALQSVYKTDKQPHHKTVRLIVFIHASQSKIDTIIKKHENLQQLVKNEWIFIKALK